MDHPTRVTCRYLRGTGERLPFPPPLMERESLASRVIEMGPLTANFKVPVLLEVPHFAGVRGGERELIVLRCDDGKPKNTCMHKLFFVRNYEFSARKLQVQ